MRAPLIPLVAATTLLLDQASKLAILFWLRLDERGEVDVFAPYLNFRMAWNRGVNFGLMADDAQLMRWFLIAVALAISGWVWRWVLREGAGKWSQVAAGFLVGGAVGNVIDRLAYGAVADFLNMSCCGIENPFSFNVADVGVFLGAAGLVLFSGKSAAKPTGRKTP